MSLIALLACAEIEVQTTPEVEVSAFVAPDPGLALQALGAVVQADATELELRLSALRNAELEAFEAARSSGTAEGATQALELRDACLIWPTLEAGEDAHGILPLSSRLLAAARVDAIRGSGLVDKAVADGGPDPSSEALRAVDEAAVEMQVVALRDLSELARFADDDFDRLVSSEEVRGWLGVQPR